MITQLELDFNKAKEDLMQAACRFEQAAQNLAQQNKDSRTPVDASADELRATVRRLVGCLVTQSGLPYPAAWVMAYHELYKDTGFHPIIVGARMSSKTFLDAVQLAGKLDDLKDTVLKMLGLKQYAKA